MIDPNTKPTEIPQQVQQTPPVKDEEAINKTEPKAKDDWGYHPEYFGSGDFDYQ